jgi:hypothetical protein
MTTNHRSEVLPAKPKKLQVVSFPYCGGRFRPSDKLSPGSVAKLSDHKLIAHLKKHFAPAKRQWQREMNYLLEAHRRYSQPGRRMPLPGRPFWGVFCKQQLGVDIRTVQRWIAEAEGRPPKKHQRDKYTAVDIAHLERVAYAAQKLAEDNPDDEAFEPIRRAIAQKPSGLLGREGRVDVLHNKYYEGNKADGKHYILSPKTMWEGIQQQYPGIVDICPYPRPKGYNALTAPWHKMNYANIPFGVTIDPITGKKEGPTAWARRGIVEQAKGNSTLYVFPVDYFFYLLIKAGAVITPRGPVSWVAVEDGSSQPSGRNIVDIFLPGKEVA